MSGTVRDVMNPKLLYIREGDRLSLARHQILSFGVTAVPVLDDTHRPVGIVSLRDLAEGDGETVELRNTPVATVAQDEPIADAARKLAETTYHHLVVVDDKGVAVGMVSSLDFLRALVGLPPRHPGAFERF